MSQPKNASDSRLAIHGGPPAISQPPPVWPVADEAIRTALDQALTDHTWGNYHGPWLERLTASLCDAFATDHAHLCSSGTIAVELALRGVGVRSGDEVILAGYDFPGNFRAIEAINAFPVLIDVVTDGWVLGPAEVIAAVTEKTKAVVVSHLHGQVADISSLRTQLLDAGHGSVAIVEDVCQCPGGSLDGQPLGSFGDVAAFSFGGSKLLSAGRGGAVVTNDARIAQRLRIANDRGNEAYPLSQLQAIVLGPQLDALGAMNTRRNENARRLIESTRGVPARHPTLTPMRQTISHSTVAPAFFKVPFLLNLDHAAGWTREQWLAAATAEGIPIAAGFRGFGKRSTRRCRQNGKLDNSQRAAEQTVVLHHPILLSDDATIQALIAAFEKLDQAIQ